MSVLGDVPKNYNFVIYPRSVESMFTFVTIRKENGNENIDGVNLS